MTVLNFNNLSLATEIGSSFGMLILTCGALIYITKSKQRVQSWTNVLIFVTLIIAFSCQSALSIYDLKNKKIGDTELDQGQKTISNILYALQFVFQWLSLLIFTLEYLSTEQEVRKVLGMPSNKNKREYYAAISVSLLILAVTFTYLICRWSGESFFDSWASSLGECIVAGALLLMQGAFIKQISVLIQEADLDLTPVRRTFCANLSVVGFIFLVQCGDVALHVITNIFLKKSVSEQQQANSTTFLILALSIQLCLIGAYFSFFLLIFRSTKGARTFEDLILHQEVPELVYLQTRKLLRDQQYYRAEKRRVHVWRDDDTIEYDSHRRRKSQDDFLNNSKSQRRSVINADGGENNNEEEDQEQKLLPNSADIYIKNRKTSIDISRASSANINKLSMSQSEAEQKIKNSLKAEAPLKSSLKQKTFLESVDGAKSPSYLKVSDQKSSTVKSSNLDAQSFYTAHDNVKSGSLGQVRKTETDDFMSALDSSTPYQEMVDQPSSIELQQSKTTSNEKRSQSSSKEPKLITIKEEVYISKDSSNKHTDLLKSDFIEDGVSEDGDNASVDSSDVRERAKSIMRTYNERLVKVGQSQFQIRLNIFFTFVQASTVEAEPYDYLQSVEGSIMNDDDNSVIERMYNRTSSRLSQISQLTGNLSD